MDTRSKSNAEFRNEVIEILAQHESRFDHMNSTLQTILTELQALRVSHSTHSPPPKINPFYPGESSHSPCRLQHDTSNGLHRHPQEDLDIVQPLPSVPSILVIVSSAATNRDKCRVQFQPTLAKPKLYSTPTSGILGSPPNQRGKPDMNTPTIFWRITNQKAQEDQEKELYYHSDEKFVPWHLCERPQIFMIEDSLSLDSIDDDIMEEKLVRKFSFHSTFTNHPT